MSLPRTVRDHLAALLSDAVSYNCGPDFDFVLVLRAGAQQSYVMTDVPPERARSMLIDALHHPDTP